MEFLFGHKVEFFPLIGLLLLSEAITTLRRAFRKAYIPAYFMFVGHPSLDKQVAKYYLDGRNPEVGDALMDDEEAERLRRRIIIQSSVSLFLSILIVPPVLAAYTVLFQEKGVVIYSTIALALASALRINLLVNDLHQGTADFGYITSKHLIIYHLSVATLSLFSYWNSVVSLTKVVDSNGVIGLAGEIRIAVVTLVVQVLPLLLGPVAALLIVDPKYRKIRKEAIIEQQKSEDAAT